MSILHGYNTLSCWNKLIKESKCYQTCATYSTIIWKVTMTTIFINLQKMKTPIVTDNALFLLLKLSITTIRDTYCLIKKTNLTSPKWSSEIKTCSNITKTNCKVFHIQIIVKWSETLVSKCNPELWFPCCLCGSGSNTKMKQSLSTICCSYCIM